MKRRVLIISQLAYPLFNPEVKVPHGGAELDLFNIAKFLDKDKFDVHFIVGDFGQPLTEAHDRITLHRSSKVGESNPVQGLFKFVKLYRLIKKIDPDVIFSESAGWLIVELILIKKMLKKKFVFRSAHKRNLNGYTDSRAYGRYYRRFLNNIDYFIIQNNDDEPVFRQHFNYAGPVKLIRNLQPIKKEEPRPFEDRKHLLWVGRSETIKKPELFLRLAKELPKEKCVMIMTKTNPAVFDKIEKQSKGVPNLRLINGVPRDQIMAYFEQARYFVSTSEGEGFPNVILESMKSGTPVISLYLDYDDIIKAKKCGFVGQGQMEQVVDFIKQTDQTEWQKMSKNCYRFACDNFDIQKGIKAYEEIFRDLS